MRLAEFILTNVEPILAEWEVFARSIWPLRSAEPADPVELRDDAEAILRATAADMVAQQTSAQRKAKSEGTDRASPASGGVNRASETHGVGRVSSGFELWGVVAEYRALRASVLRLWRDSCPKPDLNDVDDITRFNESIDQSLTEAVRAYTEQIVRDREALVAEERSSRIEAENANRAKDMFLAILSHELRTPLNAIVGWMGILRSADRNDADLVEGLDAIDRNTRAQVQLIGDILDVSRIVSGKLRLDIRPCELVDSVKAGIESVRPAALARGITLDERLDPASNRSSCDTGRIQQIVWNLVSNAVKFTPKGGRVIITLAREASSAQIEIIDNGQGISADVLPRIFERFTQADSSTRRRTGGLGLGLSIVKHLVEAHGGTIDARSEGVGRGSTFTVRLPVQAVRLDEDRDERQKVWATDHSEPDPDEPDLPPDLPSTRLDGLRVLVVDDQPDARRLMTKVLDGVGAIVTTANNGAEALEVLAKTPPNVLVSDLGMPDMDGFELIRAVRERGYTASALPAVALTAFVQKNDERLALSAGFQAHLPKPVDLRVIARLAGRASLGST